MITVDASLKNANCDQHLQSSVVVEGGPNLSPTALGMISRQASAVLLSMASFQDHTCMITVKSIGGSAKAITEVSQGMGHHSESGWVA